MHTPNKTYFVITVIATVLGAIAALITIADKFGWQPAVPQWMSVETVRVAIGAVIGMLDKWPVGPFWSAALIVVISGIFILAVIETDFFYEDFFAYLVGLLLASPFAALWVIKFGDQVGTVSFWLYGALFALGPVLAFLLGLGLVALPVALFEKLTTVQSVEGRITKVRRQESHVSDGDKSTTFVIEIDCDDGTAKTVLFKTSKRKSTLLKVGNDLKATGSWRKGTSEFPTENIQLSSQTTE